MNRKQRTTLPRYTEFKQRNSGKNGEPEMETKTALWRVNKSSPTSYKGWCGEKNYLDACSRRAIVLQEIGTRSFEVTTEDGHIFSEGTIAIYQEPKRRFKGQRVVMQMESILCHRLTQCLRWNQMGTCWWEAAMFPQNYMFWGDLDVRLKDQINLIFRLMHHILS